MQNENLNIKRIFADSELYIDKRIEISGWVRNHRRQKAQGFMDFSTEAALRACRSCMERKYRI